MTNILLTLIALLQVLSALGVIILVLLQHGKGADMGAAFGSGASGSLFGATGAANFLSRTTAILAAVFFVCTLALALLSNQNRSAAPRSVMEQSAPTAPAGSEAPAAGAAAPAETGAAQKSGAASDIPK